MFTNFTLIEVDQIVQAKAANPTVPFLVVANPDDGPGPTDNSSYGAGLKQLQSAGITVLGYVPTDWGDASISAIEQQAHNFYDWYAVDGIYLDQMYNLEFSQNGAFMPTYYSTLTAYIKSLGMTEVFGNSGANVPYYFLGSVDVIGEYENAHAPSLSVLEAWQTTYDKANFAFFAYNVTSLNPYYIAAASDDVSYMYLTSGESPSPYSTLPSYFGQLVDDLGSMVPVTVQTDAPNGTSVQRGFNVTVTQPDGISNTGYAPSTFDIPAGSTVTVEVQNNGGYVFDHWAGGNTSQTIEFKPTQATTLVAYSKTASSNVSVVTIHTAEKNGIPVTGIYATASMQGKIVARGYTPFSFVAARGTNYTVEIANYSTYSFSSWANGTTTDNDQAISIIPDHDTLLNAYVTNSTSDVTSSTAATVTSAASTNSSATASPANVRSARVA
jgi:hypothetical protein